jgi:hypothetical protein
MEELAILSWIVVVVVVVVVARAEKVIKFFFLNVITEIRGGFCKDFGSTINNVLCKS